MNPLDFKDTIELRRTRTTILNAGTPESKREEILRYFHATYSIDEQLYDTLIRDEAFYLRPEPLRHPLIFYLGHTAAFYINKLSIAKLIDHRINHRFESMFAIGVDEMSWDDLNDAHYDWPTVSEVRAYRQQVREEVDSLIRSLPLTLPITWDSPFWAIMMGIEHQRIHLETSSVIIRRLPIHEVQELPLWPICPDSGEPPPNSLLPVKGGQVSLGKEKTHPLYGWDNEFGTHTATILDFKAAQYLVSNREFLEFVRDEGYHNSQWWTAEGWNWVTYSKSEHPLFWINNNGSYQFRTMAKIIDMPWNWPVEVNYLEAKAFCNWKAAKTDLPIRLPSEDEWYRLRDIHDIPDQPWWQTAPGNINLEHWASSCPIDQFRFGNFYDIIGNVWQWTETPISGFEGFEVHPFYDDFSTPTFDTQHNLIKGGSWISTGNEATRDSRYAFRRHFFQHAGFRYVESSQPLAEPQAMYETDQAVSQYCDLHFGPDHFGVESFPVQCARICLEHMAGRPKTKALELGCSVGRASFELAKEFDTVHGLDFSARFIKIAFQLQEKGYIRYELCEEGDIVSYHEHSLAEYGLDQFRGKVAFHQADAANLKDVFTGYDLVFAGNLIDRMVNPARFLSTIHERLNPGGLLVLASPYTWLESFTKKDKWIGGFRKDGEPFSTLEGLTEILQPHFKRIAEPRDVEFVIRETRRKFQHSLSQLTIWEKRI
ncbi:5-histidylcysteine sulfoxide synthase [Desulfopila aestuarii]|uniref:5-histidylcysteine sulfoxide synthase/putative 4-mercaptohistidine N1-methyltranferase n=1 Tax=Desulfopila aestuarii DSM 18488 TaxID=1121416 RepID=A0A1M7Y350_9BACT|nr:5-histidylcysteine sulfoxide synthase [Desulfopila aestuarii]SHO46580.1 5-histidylcysteine sulfoxide synthase/putative 4-mercaptohistidine N1-methyltranferase [Desulfopila aestuarii DSM 18488]